MFQKISLHQKVAILGVFFIAIVIFPILLLNPSHEDYTIILLWIILIASFGMIAIYLMVKYLTKPLKLITESLAEAKNGNLSHHIDYDNNDELGLVATHINELTEDFGHATDFVKEIDAGNLNATLKTKNSESALLHALENMRARMVAYTSEEQERMWVSQGVNKISELLRRNTTSVKEMGEVILKELVKYLDASQGALFVVEENNEVILKMEACYALNRQKFLKKEVRIKEGLVGQAYLEKDMIHLREIPENYLKIVSGLGDIKPHSLIMFPLIENEITYGVIELASLHKFQEHQIEFLKTISSTLANYIANTLNFTKTQALLEQSQKQAEQLRTQEEEMRQNMEELEATQEQMQRKNVETEEANNRLQNSMQKLQTAQEEMDMRNKELEKIKIKLEANEDILKKAFTKTKEKEKNIIEQNKELEQKQLMIQQQHDELQSKNIYLTDSIKYAQRIQSAILPDDENLAKIFASYFVLFMPKDMVSGDFYWYTEVENKRFIAAVDCTGHGVPGAFMSLIGHSLLNQIIKEKHIHDTDKILEYLNEGIIESLKQKTTSNVDGMDVSLCCVEELNNRTVNLHFTGAKCPAFYIKGNNLVKFKGDRRSIGGHQKENLKPFKKHSIELESGDKVFLTTDGLIDAADKNRKRFGSKRLEDILRENMLSSLADIKDALMSNLDNHTKGSKQRDDITFVGFEIK